MGAADRPRLANCLRPTRLSAMARTRWFEQRADFYAERLGQPHEHADGHVVAGLDSSQVASVDLHFVCELLLDPAAGLSQLDDALPEVTADALDLVHRGTMVRLS